MLYRRIYNSPFDDFSRSFQELDTLHRQMDQLFGSLSSGASGPRSAGVFPLTNVTEDRDNYYIRAELPGMKADELDIQATSNGISISGERKIATEGNNVRYHRREREAGKFSRLIGMPGDVDTGKVDARLENGILTITVPKAETAKPRQITVK